MQEIHLDITADISLNSWVQCAAAKSANKILDIVRKGVEKKPLCAISLLSKTLTWCILSVLHSSFLHNSGRTMYREGQLKWLETKQLLDREKLKSLGLLILVRRMLEVVCVCMINFYKIIMVVDKVNASSTPTVFKPGTVNETSRRSVVSKWKKVLPKIAVNF